MQLPTKDKMSLLFTTTGRDPLWLTILMKPSKPLKAWDSRLPGAKTGKAKVVTWKQNAILMHMNMHRCSTEIWSTHQSQITIPGLTPGLESQTCIQTTDTSWWPLATTLKSLTKSGANGLTWTTNMVSQSNIKREILLCSVIIEWPMEDLGTISNKAKKEIWASALEPTSPELANSTTNSESFWIFLTRIK